MSPSRHDNGPLIVGGEPRIDFLPIETKMRKENRRRRRSYVALVIAVIAACAVAITFTAKRTLDAEAALKVEQERTSEILKEQREYSEVVSLSADSDAVRSARLVGSATDIMWRDVIHDVLDTLEAPLEYAFSIDSQSALETQLVLEEPLQKPAIATVFLHFAVDDVAIADEIIANIPKMPAYADATATSTAWQDDKGFYQVDITLHITVDALDRRYFLNPPVSDSTAEDED